LSIAVFVAVFALTCVQAAQAQNFGSWSAPSNIGAPVNSQPEDWQPFITKDGLSLYFVRGVAPNAKGWVAKRNSTDDPWGTPELLPDTINSMNVGFPFVTPDGHWLYFNTTGGIVRSWRQNKKMESGPSGWQTPVNLGDNVNLGGGRHPWLFEDEETGETILYFVSQRFGSFDLFQSTMQPDGTFGPAEEVAGINLNTANLEQEPSVSHNGRELYFSTNRPGSQPDPITGNPSRDIWVSTRESTRDPWSEPQPVTVLNSPFVDGRPWLSWNGLGIYFYSARPGNVSQRFDIWMATREKVPAREP
jgi:hypothetical protein